MLASNLYINIAIIICSIAIKYIISPSGGNTGTGDDPGGLLGVCIGVVVVVVVVVVVLVVVGKVGVVVGVTGVTGTPGHIVGKVKSGVVESVWKLYTKDGLPFVDILTS